MSGVSGTLTPQHDQLGDAAEQGRICALAVQGGRDLQKRAAAYPELFAAEPFDPALFNSIALAIAFGAPWCTAEQLRVTNRAVLWGFAVDWLVDHMATSRAEIDALTVRCLAVVDGATPDPDDELARFLAEIRDDLAAAPNYPRLRPIWRAELERMLTAMAREWDWKSSTGSGRPSLSEYLANADNLACTFVNVAHWIHTGDADTLAHLDELLRVSGEVQRILRLVNDLGTYQRDLRWGDLNALLLVDDRTEVERHLAELMRRCRQMLVPLEHSCPVQAAYLSRQIGFSSGFYRSTDFWGTS